MNTSLGFGQQFQPVNQGPQLMFGQQQAQQGAYRPAQTPQGLLNGIPGMPGASSPAAAQQQGQSGLLAFLQQLQKMKQQQGQGGQQDPWGAAQPIANGIGNWMNGDAWNGMAAGSNLDALNQQAQQNIANGGPL